MTPEEKQKLSALVIGEEGGVEISGTVNADNVTGLDAKIANVVGNQFGSKEDLVNKIDAIALPSGTPLVPDENKTVTLPLFTEGNYGLIKGAALIDGVPVLNAVYAKDGIGEVKAISTDILKNGAEEFVLNGGSAEL